jgi:DNA-3-methyladenine glycosylase II
MVCEDDDEDDVMISVGRSIKTRRVIESDGDVAQGIRALRRRCAVMRRMHDASGDPPLRRPAGGLPGLARIVIGQQVSVASAAAIWKRFEAEFPDLSAVALIGATDEKLSAAGLSGPKKPTLRAIGQAIANGLDLDVLAVADDAVVRDELTRISGIGPWTADIYVMFCLGRADGFAPGDLALQIAAGMAYGSGERITADALDELAEAWRPWRSVAARLLWAYYAVAKRPQSGVPV